MSKICLIRQPAGIGDIFFCQKIAHHYNDLGYDVVWPVDDVYSFLNDYMGTDKIKFISQSEIPHFDMEIILDGAHHKFPGKQIMTSKYFKYNIDHNDWEKYFNFKRNYKKEKVLFDQLTNNEPYIFVNKKYGTPPNYSINNSVTNTIIDKSLRIVELDLLDNFTIFDWSTIFENAEEIHTIDTSINYIFDKLKLKTDKIFVYPRLGNQTIFELDGLFKTNFEWIL